jgi:hypothetical protein
MDDNNDLLLFLLLITASQKGEPLLMKHVKTNVLVDVPHFDWDFTAGAL